MGTMFVTDVSTLPTSGAAWSFLLNRDAALNGMPIAGTNIANLSSQNEWTQTNALCSALVYLRIGNTDRPGRLAKIESLLTAVPGTEIGTAQTLNVFRQLGCWMQVADAIDFDPTTVCANGQTWGAWCDARYTTVLNGFNGRGWDTVRHCGELAGNNWGGYARHAWIATAIHRGNTTELNRAINAVKRWLGDTGITNTYGTDADYDARGASWCTDGGFPTAQGVINSVSGDERSGVNVDDVTRTGTTFSAGCTAGWDGHTSGVSYQQENAEAVWATFVLLHQAGHDECWEWSDQALLRNLIWLRDFGQAFSNMYAMYRAIPYLATHRYGDTFPLVGESGNTGRAAAGYSWLSLSSTWVLDDVAPTPFALPVFDTMATA